MVDYDVRSSSLAATKGYNAAVSDSLGILSGANAAHGNRPERSEIENCLLEITADVYTTHRFICNAIVTDEVRCDVGPIFGSNYKADSSTRRDPY